MHIRCNIGFFVLICQALGLNLHSSNSLPLDNTSRCDADWGVFGTDELIRTAHNTKPSNFSDPPGHPIPWGVFVQPALKFGLCLIPKVGSLTWQKRLCNMLGFDDGVCNEEGTGVNGNHVTLFSQSLFGRTGYKQVFDDPLATRVVFVRDPLSRFVSAFLDKCMSSNIQWGTDVCPGFKEGMVFGDLVSWALTADLVAADYHFRPQAYHCDLNRTISQYTVIGLMTKESFNSDITCSLALAGLNNYDSNATFRHSNISSSIKEENVLQKFFTQAAARDLIQRYRIDYDTFHLKEPAWVVNATGEWFNMAPKVLTELIASG